MALTVFGHRWVRSRTVPVCVCVCDINGATLKHPADALNLWCLNPTGKLHCQFTVAWRVQGTQGCIIPPRLPSSYPPTPSSIPCCCCCCSSSCIVLGASWPTLHSQTSLLYCGSNQYWVIIFSFIPLISVELLHINITASLFLPHLIQYSRKINNSSVMLRAFPRLLSLGTKKAQLICRLLTKYVLMIILWYISIWDTYH